MYDILVIGAGPAGTAIAAALAEQGLRVLGLAPEAPNTSWVNTYAAWADDVDSIGLGRFLQYRWQDCAAYTDQRKLALHRTYGLFDNQRLQEYLLTIAESGNARWHIGSAARVEHHSTHSVVYTRAGMQHSARLVIDASGHRPALVQRQIVPGLAYQAAYGIIGTYSRPPVSGNQMVLMDYRSDHLTVAERAEPPTFLYAMNLGNGSYFLEETSLAHAPGVSLKTLERRLHQRLMAQGIEIEHVQHVERCFFPMNPALPDRKQRVVGFGAAASMVHPPSGYLVSSALAAAPGVARAIACALGAAGATPAAVAHAGWQAIWPDDRVQRRYLYLFCLASLMRCNLQQTQEFFQTFFELPYHQWSGYFSATLTTAELCRTMWQIFTRLPFSVRMPLVRSVASESGLLWQAVCG
jgi:lycopene beta-cyclase